jgi:glutamine amidotransferase
MIALVDYGAGNLTSVRKALAHLDAPATTPTRPAELDSADGIIVPGVGNFEVTAALGADWRAAISAHIEQQRPVLGICVGMQWLFDGSTEAPGHPGLQMMTGTCSLITDQEDATPEEHRDGSDRVGGRLKVPHVGWNTLRVTRPSWLLDGVDKGAQVYFTHSFAAPVTADCVGATRYGIEFAAAVERGLVAGVQFHPEKSSDVGLRILRNFLQRAS